MSRNLLFGVSLQTHHLSLLDRFQLHTCLGYLTGYFLFWGFFGATAQGGGSMERSGREKQ